MVIHITNRGGKTCARPGIELMIAEFNQNVGLRPKLLQPQPLAAFPVTGAKRWILTTRPPDEERGPRKPASFLLLASGPDSGGARPLQSPLDFSRPGSVGRC